MNSISEINTARNIKILAQGVTQHDREYDMQKGRQMRHNDNREVLVDALGDVTERQGEPALVAYEELSEANVVCDECSDDAECSAGLVAGGVVEELACRARMRLGG